ncbi:MAG: dihydrodipicolinate synthase family protein [Candidatus Paceibacterota bacterium]
MKSLYPLRGIISVLNTPFSVTGSVDIPALILNVNNAINAGVSGFLIPAMASEVYSLTNKEKLKMVENVLLTADKEVHVFVGVSGNNFDERYNLLKSYLNMGCKQVLFQIPFENAISFKKQFYKLADLNPETIMLQDWDSSGYGLPDSLISELFEQVENFKCLKIETNPAGIKYSRIIELTKNQLHVSGGWAVNQMIEGLNRGVHAFMPTGMHYIYTQIYRNYVSGNQKQAKQLFEEILPVLSFSNQHLDISIQFFKRLLYKQQIYKTDNVRKLSYKFDAVHEEIADELIDRVIKLEAHIMSER